MTNTQKKFHREAGVTLVEMMVVIVIIGLITAIVALNVMPALDRARDGRVRADIAVIEQALETYQLDHARPPGMEEGLEALIEPGEGREAYIKGDLPHDPWGQPYQYVIPGAHGPYDIYSFGADGKEGGEGADADIGNWTADSAAK